MDAEEDGAANVPDPEAREERSFAAHAAAALTVGSGITLGVAGRHFVDAAAGAIKDKLAPKDEASEIERPAGYDHD